MFKFVTQRGLLLLVLLFIVACGSETTEPEPTEVVVQPTEFVATAEPTEIPVEPTIAEPTEAPTSEAVEEPTSEVVEEPTVAPTMTPAPTEPPQPTNTPVPEPTTGGIQTYNLLQATLTESSPLYVSPKNPAQVIPIEIAVGEKVSVMGKNSTGSHLRVVWNTGVGWVPTSFTTFIGDRNRMDALPIFEREPPQCAIPITTQLNLNSTWDVPQRTRIAVIVDLFRSRFGEFPDSSLALSVNGVTIEESRRAIEENGQFSLKDVVLTLPGYLQAGDTLGYVLETTADEPLVFVASLLDVPQNCIWDID